MTYQPPYQQTMNQPVVVQPVLPVVIPVVTGLTGLQRNQGVDVGGCHVPGACIIFLGFFGFAFVVMSLFMLIFDAAMGPGEEFWSSFDRTHSPIRYPMIILGSIGVIFATTSVGFCFIARRNKRIQESQENTQPISEPFTQDQMNQGSPMYVPVQSGVLPPSQNTHQGPGFSYPDNNTSASYSAQTSNMPQPFHHGPIDTGPDAAQNFGPEKVPFVEYDQQPAFAPPPYSS